MEEKCIVETVGMNFPKIRLIVTNAVLNKMELSRYVQSEIPQNLSFNDKALDLRSGA